MFTLIIIDRGWYMDIVFDIKDITQQEKHDILWLINRDKLNFEEYIYKNHLDPQEDPFNYKIIIRDKMFGLISSTYMNPDIKQIIFNGIDDLHIITHEWVHAAFPNKNCSRHAEGFAIYIQIELGIFHLKGFSRPMDLVKSYMHSYNKESVSDWFAYIRNNQNFSDSRWGRMVMTRSISAEFVGYLIDKYGIVRYLKDFYFKLRDDKNSIWREELEFATFIESIPKSSPTSLVPFLELKASFIESYSKYFIPKSGSVLSYLMDNKNKIEPKEYDFLQNVAIEDLRTTLLFYA